MFATKYTLASAPVAVGRSGSRMENGLNASGLMGERLMVSDEPQKDSFAQRSWLYADDPALNIRKNGRPVSPTVSETSLQIGEELSGNKSFKGWSYHRKAVLTGTVSNYKKTHPHHDLEVIKVIDLTPYGVASSLLQAICRPQRGGIGRGCFSTTTSMLLYKKSSSSSAPQRCNSFCSWREFAFDFNRRVQRRAQHLLDRFVRAVMMCDDDNSHI